MDIVPKIQKRKAVAPIIATLLLVAIAVVGGIIVFVWASGMFGSTSGTALPNAESLQLIGYDARDVADLTNEPDIDNTPSNALTASGDHIMLKVRNTGSTEVRISEVQIMGVQHVWESDGTVPEAGEFALYTKATGDGTLKTTTHIAPGEDARIAVKLGAVPDDISLGRNLQMKVKTNQGSVFNFFTVTGQTE